MRALGFSIPRVAADELTKAAILSCTSTPPRRIYLTHAADLLTSYVDRKPRSTSASRKLFGPSAFPETGTHLCADPFEPASRKRYRAPEMSRLQGLATLWTCGLVPTPLEASFSPQRSWASLFRALSPSRWSERRFRRPLRSCASL
jgi:hypothetical protein